jgi:hypothetical protein
MIRPTWHIISFKNANSYIISWKQSHANREKHIRLHFSFVFGLAQMLSLYVTVSPCHEVRANWELSMTLGMNIIWAHTDLILLLSGQVATTCTGEVPDKLTVAQLIKRIYAYYETGMFTVVFTRNRYSLLTWTRWKVHTNRFFKTYFNIMLPSTSRTFEWSLPSMFLRLNIACTPRPSTCATYHNPSLD